MCFDVGTQHKNDKRKIHERSVLFFSLFWGDYMKSNIITLFFVIATRRSVATTRETLAENWPEFPSARRP